jgi:hypothetical protein
MFTEKEDLYFDLLQLSHLNYDVGLMCLSGHLYLSVNYMSDQHTYLLAKFVVQ